MIRMFQTRFQPLANHWRVTQFTTRRLCSHKSDESNAPASESIDEETDAPSCSSPKHIDSKKYAAQYANDVNIMELIEILPSNSKSITKEDLIEFYGKIRLQDSITHKTINHPKFTVLREATVANLSQFNTKELKNLMVAILPSKAVMNDQLGRSIADALIERSTFLPFEQIIFIDFVMRKYYNLSELSSSYNMLRLRLQTLFLMKIEDVLNDNTDFEELMKIVAYCSNNSEIISTKMFNILTTSLLLTDDEKLTVTHIMSCLILLASKQLNDHTEKLLNRMILLWRQSNVNATEVQVLLKVLAARKQTIDLKYFKNEEFIRHCVMVVTQQTDRKLSFSVQNFFNRLDFISQDLIDHLSHYFDENIRDMTIYNYIVFCTACAKADFKPSNWESTILPALKTFAFRFYLNNLRGFDWPEFALRLHKLGYCDPRFIQRIIYSKNAKLQKSYDQNKIAKLKEILEQENVTSSDSSEESDSESSDTDGQSNDDVLYDDLKDMLGANKIWSNVKIAKRVTVPYVLKMNLVSGDLLPFPKEPSIRDVNEDELLIGIVVVDDETNQWTDRNKMNYAKEQSRRMERKGISSIIIKQSKWNTLKTYEKSLIFYTKILNMMEQYRKNKLKRLGRD